MDYKCDENKRRRPDLILRYQTVDMARKSTSSSTTSSNGNPPAPAGIPEQATARRLVSGTSRIDTDDEFDWESPQYAIKSASLAFDASLLPDGSRSLSSIGLQAFACGFTLSACLLSTAWLVQANSAIWRLPAFFACLSLFHFLEFWTTARFNLPAARASSFLLYANGWAYNAAHALAALEIVVSSFIPSYQYLFVNSFSIAVGFALITLGQVVRSVAMAHAGTNFSHTPAKVKKEGHQLVSDGIYAWLRHPSYFGFFWWALGTQVLVGNKICLLGYVIALWTFFNRRIRGELKQTEEIWS